MPWSDDDDEDDSSSGVSSTLDTDTEDNDGSNKSKKKIGSASSRSSKEKSSGVETVKRKSKGIDFAALSRHGYEGGHSVLNIPPPKESDDPKNWSWSTGKESRAANEKEETYEERQKTRAALLEGEQLANARTQQEKNLSFSQKEKRKRDLGQASRGKSYVEEEKRLLRENGIYSGFDS